MLLNISNQLATRFAPTTSGYAHPGTLMSALLCWLDARSRGAKLGLRLENLDRERCRPEYAEAMQRDLAWLGLDWDVTQLQSDLHEQHEAALDRLAKLSLLYPCDCSRARLKSLGRLAPDGGYAYDNACRANKLPAHGWRACRVPLRLRLPDCRVDLRDEGGLMLSATPALDFGDPIVRRRDGACAYHLAVVVDDAAAGYSRLIRGRDLATSAATQVLLQQALNLPQPQYRHHLLLLEAHGKKLAKFHGAVAVPELRQHYTARQLCGLLAAWLGLNPQQQPMCPQDLLPVFNWAKVTTDDVLVGWDGQQLTRRFL